MTIYLTQLFIQDRWAWKYSDNPLSVILGEAVDVFFSLKTKKEPPGTFFVENSDIRASKNGDSDAFRRLIERHQRHVSKLLWRFTRDTTSHEEMVQETFVQAYLSLKTYKTQAPFEHWLTRIATRVGYRFWKQQSRHAHASLQDVDWQRLFEDSSGDMSPQEAAELVHTFLAKLPPRDRLVLTLRYLEQCSVDETAKRTGWSKALVKVQTHRAKQKLKDILENTDIDFEVSP